MSTASEVTGPDLTQGIASETLADGAMLAGHVGDEAVLLARRGDEVFAIGATCTHYSGPLAEGLIVGDTVRCPWHHACFSLRTGEALRAPALEPGRLLDGRAARRQGRSCGRSASAAPRRAPRPAPERRRRIVIVGGGAAGQRRRRDAAPRGLRRAASRCSSADDAPPVDRPNLSKDYLAGNAPEEWIPLRAPEFYAEQRHRAACSARASTAIDAARAKRSRSATAASVAYDALLLATGAEPVRLPLPGADLPHVHYLRTLADSRAIIAQAERRASARW